MTKVEVDLASLSLFPATPVQVEESRRRMWLEWYGHLSLAEYLKRYEELDALEPAKDRKLATWVLAPREDPTTVDFMCACETYKRTGLVAYPSSSLPEPNSVREATCYIVAMVLTPPSKRRHGYASHMMSLLHWVIASRAGLPEFPEAWGAPPEEVAYAGGGLFSVLHSIVGEEFYRSAGPRGEGGGWEKRGAMSTIWEVGEEVGDDEGWTWLTQDKLDEFWNRDAERIRKEIERMPMSDYISYELERPEVFVTYLPTDGLLRAHVPHSTYGSMEGGIWGVQSSSDPDTYAGWSINTRPSTPILIVARLCASEETFPGLITKIKQAENVAEKTGGRTFERNKDLPQIVWYGPGATGNVEWAFNEKWVFLRSKFFERFGWC